MVVGQHVGAQRFKQELSRLGSAAREQHRGELEVERARHLEVLAVDLGDDHDDAPARSTSQASSVAAASTSCGDVERALERLARNTCGVCTDHSSERSSVSCTPPVASTRLIVSVTGAAAIAASTPLRRASSAAIVRRGELGRQQRPRGVVHEHRIARRRRAASARRTDSERDAPPSTPTTPARRLDVRAAARRRSARSRPRRAARRCSTAASADRRARRAPSGGPAASRSPRPAATISATAISKETVAHAPVLPSPALERAREPVTRPLLQPSGWWPSPRAARRGSSRPRPRPCRARTSARRRGSSWRA